MVAEPPVFGGAGTAVASTVSGAAVAPDATGGTHEMIPTARNSEPRTAISPTWTDRFARKDAGRGAWAMSNCNLPSATRQRRPELARLVPR